MTPIEQDDGPSPVCSIAYTPQFQDTMNYFRAVLQSDERSERALKLTKEVIFLNAANYTAWYFRRLVLESLNWDLKKELKFVSSIGLSNPKNYQIWYHRRWVVEKLGDFSKELSFTGEQIEDENKNYHAWAYRQWVIETKGWWEQELQFIDELLKTDVRNNSAWNQRFFCLTQKNTKSLSIDDKKREITFAFSHIKRAPNNQSPWAYLKGLFAKDKFSSVPELKAEVLEFREKYVTSPHAASLLVDIYEQEGTPESVQEAQKLCETLETSLDSLHRKYWNYRRSKMGNV